MSDCGANFGADLTDREVDYPMREEWATADDDVLRCRSKLGLRFSAARTCALDDFMRCNAATPSVQSEWRRAG